MPRSREVEFSRKDRTAIIARANGCCEKCGAVLKVGEAEVDHILPAELGGKPERANGQCLCRVCHREKTTADVQRIRKSDRQRDRNSGAIRSKQSIPGRQFPKRDRSERLAQREELRELSKASLAERGVVR